MTRAEWKGRLSIIEAFANGAKVQMSIDGGESWSAHDDLEFKADLRHYRLAPAPRLRPWRAEEVPVGAMVLFKDTCRAIISATSTDGTAKCGDKWHTTRYLLDATEGYSTDGGKTWAKCGGVMEGEA